MAIGYPRIYTPLLCFAFFVIIGWASTAQSLLFADQPKPTLHNGGAAYLWSEGGRLDVEIFRRDRASSVSHWDTVREVRVQLFDPVRELIREIEMPTPEPVVGAEWSNVVSQRIEVKDVRKGVYLLLLTVKRDSYVQSIRWGVRANTRGLLIDASAGHRDAARIEPIEFLSNTLPVKLAFKPNANIFSLSLTALTGVAPNDEVSLKEITEEPRILQKRPINGNSSHAVVQVNEGTTGFPLIEMKVPAHGGRLAIEGLTSVPESDQSWMPLWAPSPELWFDLESTQWLLRPRYQTVSRDSGVFKLKLENQRQNPITGELQVFDIVDGTETLRHSKPITIDGGVQKELSLKAPDNNQTQRTRVCFESAGLPPAEAIIDYEDDNIAEGPIALPYSMAPYRHDPDSLGLNPHNLPKAEVYFSKSGRAWYCDELGVHAWDASSWKTILPAGSEYGKPTTERLFADDNNRVYSLFQKGRRYYLMAFDFEFGLLSSLELPENVRGRVVIETNTSIDFTNHPPIVLAYEKIGRNPRDPGTIWGVDHRLTAYVICWEDNKLALRESLLVSEHCIGLSDHSGRSAPVTSAGDESYVIYGETSPPNSNDPGVPTYVKAINREEGAMDSPMLVGHAPPANDIHNVSSVLVDSNGFLHVILGAHNKSFHYTRSEEPFSATEWSEKVQVAPGYDQTYVGAVLDANDTLHLVSRIWRRGEHFPDDPFDTALIYQRLKPGQTWSEPVLLTEPPLPHYGIYYHRLTIDPCSGLHLAFTQWPTWAAYRNEIPSLAPPGSAFGYLHWTSSDGGQSWRWNAHWKHQEAQP